jgi:leader peptidase (prepilin peptidase) / N-methyltransferase
MISDEFSSLVFLVPLAGVIGLFVGSFLNVVIYRVPLGLSVSKPRSFCPTCDRQLKWWENLPVASWAALRGRCRTCHQPISPRYPLVELATGLAFSLVIWRWHGSIVSAGYCALAASVIAVSMIEYDGHRSPLSVAAIGTAIAQVIIVVGGGWQHQWRIVVGTLIGSLAALIVIAILRLRDPGCADPRNHGRSCLLMAGCWLGGLGFASLAIAAGAWIIVYFTCMVGVWSASRQALAKRGTGPGTLKGVNPVLGVPLVSALVVAMAASLIVAA